VAVVTAPARQKSGEHHRSPDAKTMVTAALDPRVKDMTGKRCHLLTVMAHAGSTRGSNGNAAIWECRCRCGNRLIVVGWALRAGHTKSCGCARVAANKRRGVKQPPKSQKIYL
jgi:hypothetical protein